jgi:hypothetical protein
MVVAGKPLDTLDVISYILACFDDEYDGFVAVVTTLIKAEKNVSLNYVYSQLLLSYEAQMESRKSGDGSSINTATHGGRGGGRGHGDHQDQYHDHRYEYDRRDGYERGGYDRNNYDQLMHVKCIHELCSLLDHIPSYLIVLWGLGPIFH